MKWHSDGLMCLNRITIVGNNVLHAWAVDYRVACTHQNEWTTTDRKEQKDSAWACTSQLFPFPGTIFKWNGLDWPKSHNAYYFAIDFATEYDITTCGWGHCDIVHWQSLRFSERHWYYLLTHSIMVSHVLVKCWLGSCPDFSHHYYTVLKNFKKKRITEIK